MVKASSVEQRTNLKKKAKGLASPCSLVVDPRRNGSTVAITDNILVDVAVIEVVWQHQSLHKAVQCHIIEIISKKTEYGDGADTHIRIRLLKH